MENDSTRLAAFDGRDEDMMMAIYDGSYHRDSANIREDQASIIGGV